MAAYYETGVAPLVAGAIAAAKAVGIWVTADLLVNWIAAGDLDESVGALTFMDQTYFDIMYGSTYSAWAPLLSGAGRASLKASVVLAQKAIAEKSLTFFDAKALELLLEAKAKKLAAMNENQPDPEPSVKLLPMAELQGSPMVISTGDDAAAPALAGSVWPLLIGLGVLGVGAFLLMRGR